MSAIALSVLIVALAMAVASLTTYSRPGDRDAVSHGRRERREPREPRDGSPAPVRLVSRVLFARRSLHAITLDCTLVGVEHPAPSPEPPAGLPFTLRLQPPDTSWFAARVEQLLTEWAEENRELVFEVRRHHGRLTTTIESGDAAVHLDLVAAAGLGSRLR